MNLRKIFILALTITVYFILTQSLASGNQESQQMEIQTLPLQKSYYIEVLPGINKKIEINRQQIKKYLAHGNQHKIMKSFKLQYQSILRVAEIYVSVFSNKTHNNQEKPVVFDLNKDLGLIQSTVFNLDFLGKFSFDEILKIQLDIRSKTFSVLKLTLMNNEIANQIDIHHQSEKNQGFGMIPVWMPQSYDTQTQKFKQVTKYLYFKASQNPTKLKITRIKGHPKIFLYNCQSNKFSFCRQQIEEQHIEGTLMLQKQLQFTLEKEPKCKNCSIIIAIKNMGVQTKIQITQHKIHNSRMLSKDNPTYYHLKPKQTLELVSYFNLPQQININPYFLDISLIQGASKSLKIDFLSLKTITRQTLDNKQKIQQFSAFSQIFTTVNQQKAIKIKINPTLDLSKYLIEKDSNNQTWYKISIQLEASKMIDFSVIDRNIPSSQQNFITLKDGQILHSYVFSQTQPKSDEPKQSEIVVQNFKVKVSGISALTVSSLCSEINKMVIQYFTQTNINTNHSQKTTKMSPKVFVENITHHNKKCSQLIHLNPLQLFSHDKIDKNQQKSGWVYFKISGIKTQVDLLYSSSDIINLEKSFPYHSQLQYNQEMYFHVPNVKNQAIIKIQKCSDCQITLSFSQEQFADIKSVRSHQIVQKEVKSINNIYKYSMQDKNGLFIKVKTNNFAHFVITVQETAQRNSQQLDQIQLSQTSNKIEFSLEQNNTLTLKFPPPTFLYTNNLNSPTYFSLIEGSINVQVSRETYCPEFIFSEKQRTRDVSISQIMPQLINDDQGNQKLTFSMQVKHHDFFGIRAQKGDQIFSYKVVNIESLKTYSMYRWSIFQVALFLTFALFMSFVCFMGLKKNKVKKVGGQVIMQSQDGEQTSMIRLN